MRLSQETVARFTKFVVSGGVTALFDLLLLEGLVTIGIEPVTASVLAYIAALFLNFALQKFWSFGERDLSRTHVQLAQFAVTGLINLGINTACMYVLTYIIGLGYITAQVITLPALAIESYVIYHAIIFRRK